VHAEQKSFEREKRGVEEEWDGCEVVAYHETSFSPADIEVVLTVATRLAGALLTKCNAQ